MKNKQFYSEELETLLVEGQTHVICDFKRFHEPLCEKACLHKDCLVCKAAFRIWLDDDHVEKVKITLFEQSILHHLIECDFRYIARDKDGDLYGYIDEPEKRHCSWSICDYGDVEPYFTDLSLFDSCFNFINWEDEQPTYIYTLLENCVVIEDD